MSIELHIISEKKLLDKSQFPVIERQILQPDGQVREQLVWDRRGKEFAGVLAQTVEGDYILVNEPKYGQARWMNTLPTGGRKKDETLEDSARRELLEETGYEAATLVQVSSEPIVDFADKVAGGEHYFFVATGCKRVKEPENQIKLVLRDELEKIIKGTMKEVKLEIAMSIVGVMMGLCYLDEVRS